MINPHNADSNTLLAHRYRVIQVLGEGGFGLTYLAADTQMPSQRQCVVKQLKPIEDNSQVYQLVQERFQREAAILERLGDKHDQIPRLYAYFAEEHQFYLVEEWVEGETLTQKMNTLQGSVLQEDAVRRILLEVLPVLDYVHQNKIVHRDIKPDNILLRQGDHKPVLIDFGAVKETMNTMITAPGQTSRSIVVGTPGFMPSEQMAGHPVFASDLYGLGLTAVYLLTARMPQQLETDPSTGTYQWRSLVPGVSPAFANVIDQAIKMAPHQRFQTAPAMLNALSPPTDVVDPRLAETIVPSEPQQLPAPTGAAGQSVSSSTPTLKVPPAASTTDRPTNLSPSHPGNRHKWIWGGVVGTTLVLAGFWIGNLNKPSPSPTQPVEVAPAPAPQETSVSPSPPGPAAQSPTPTAGTTPSANEANSSANAPVEPAVPVTPAPPATSTPAPAAPAPPASGWEFMGNAATGERVSVNNQSIVRAGGNVQFQYRIGNELISATADCGSNQWFASGYGWYTPQSQATQQMMNYVCSF